MSEENKQSGTNNAPEKNGQTFGEWCKAQITEALHPPKIPDATDLDELATSDPDYEDTYKGEIRERGISETATLFHVLPDLRNIPTLTHKKPNYDILVALINDSKFSSFRNANANLYAVLYQLQSLLETKLKCPQFANDVPEYNDNGLKTIFTTPLSVLYGVKPTVAADPASGNEATPADHRPVVAALVPEQLALLEKAADHSAAERTAADVAELKGTMIEIWKLCNARTRKTTPAEKKLCAPMNDALFAYWKAFQRGKLDGTISVQAYDKHIVGRKRKRSAGEFLKDHGADVVYTAKDGTQYTVKELCPTIEDVQRMIDRNNKAIKRAEHKNGQSADRKKI